MLDITYVSDVRLLSGTGVINGIPEGSKVYFKPSALITYAEVATIFQRFVEKTGK